MTNPVIDLDRVSRRFGDLTAVDDVSLQVGAGEIVGLLGHNGAGKTTLIRVINGLLRPDHGRVRVLGFDPTVDGSEVRRRTGVLTEYPALDGFLTTRENLAVYAEISAVPSGVARQRITWLLHRLGLWDKRDERAGQLSAGLKQRVALARGLVHDPSVLLLDEPTTNMDPVAARDVRALVVESVRERGATVLLSTHNLSEAEDLCDRVAIMRNGRLLRLGAPASLRQELGRPRGVVIATTPEQVDRLLEVAGSGRRLDDHRVEVTGPGPIDEVVAAAVRAGIRVMGAEPIQATLEDLYVALHHGTPVAPMVLSGPPPPPGAQETA